MQSHTQVKAESRRLLSSFVVALSIFGILALLVVFILSGTPSARARENVPSFLVSEVEVGGFKEFKYPRYSIFAFRYEEDQFQIHWISRLQYREINGYLISPGWIQCENILVDKDSFECAGKSSIKYRWKISGQPYKESPTWIPVLEPVPYRIRAGRVRYGKGA